MPKSHITRFWKYPDENWTEKELNSFIQKIEQVIKYVSQNPLLYPYSKLNDTYRCVVVKQISLFCRLKIDKIELLIFWDNRMNPAKLKL